MQFNEFDNTVIEMLKDDHAFAVEYMKEAFAGLDEENGEVLFLLALRRLVEARGGFSKIAAQSKLNRETLYRTLSERGNPTISTTKKIINAAGIQFAELTR